MVCLPLERPATQVRPHLAVTSLPQCSPTQNTASPVHRLAIGSEPREIVLARLRARLLRMIVDNERVRHEVCIRPR